MPKKGQRQLPFLPINDQPDQAWRGLVEWTRSRHVRFRRELERLPVGPVTPAAQVVSAGV